jgi:polysaccharide biosynthesis/export protein
MHVLAPNRISFCFCGIVLAVISFLSVSCGNTRQLTYLQGTFDTAKLSQVNATEPIIRKGDLLSITVFSDNLIATQPYNQAIMAAAGSTLASSSPSVGGPLPPTSGYQVDASGNIVFPLLGTLHVEGLTKAQLTDTLDSRLDTVLTHPYYNIRFLNYKFTMLGEINKPGEINIPGERINLLEALALAGDMTFYGRRDNIMVIRESNGKREFARLDITKPDIMTSPYYYLQQNDVVIIEANKKKISANDIVVYRNITILATLVSTFAILYEIFK